MNSATIAILADGSKGLVVAKAAKSGEVVLVQTSGEPTWAIVGETVSENCTTKVVQASPAAERAIMNVAGKARKHHGCVVPPNVREGHHVLVQPGKSITIFGSEERYSANERGTSLKHYVCTFAIGDVAVYGGYNLTYTGEVVAIGPKTVTVAERHGSKKVHRMEFEEFSSLNDFFDLAEITKRNSEWMD